MKQIVKKRILNTALCSYDLQTLRSLGNFLLEYGGFHECAAYRSGKELLREMQEGRHYDALVLDEQLQDMDALEFLSKLQQIKQNPQPVTVVMAAHAFLKRLDRALPAGVDFCFLKPLQAGALAHRIQNFYNEHSEAVHAYCNQLCKEFGVQDDTANCLYLADAEFLVWQSETKLAIRKEIILPVSEAHGVSQASVDSGLRRLIERMEAANTDAYCRFKQETGLSGERPTIGCLIYAMKRYGTANREGNS
ncbi:MAG: response regulator [Faecalibacterium sp.]|jgi:CheY-like chemotaxis protein|nr:response regulator [Faecalibacterium sp.]